MKTQTDLILEIDGIVDDALERIEAGEDGHLVGALEQISGAIEDYLAEVKAAYRDLGVTPAELSALVDSAFGPTISR